MKRILIPVLLFLFVFIGRRAGAGDQQVPNACDRDGLEITVTKFQPKDGVDKRLRFAIALHNIGENDLMLNLGMILANGKKQYPHAIHLVLLDEKGISKKLILRGPMGITGQIDNYIVPLSVNATHTIVASPDDYWCPTAREFRLTFHQGTYKIVAEFEGKGAIKINRDMEGVRNIQSWLGKAVSEPLEFVVAPE